VVNLSIAINLQKIMKLSHFSLAILLAFLASSCADSSSKKFPELDYLQKDVNIDITKFFNGDLEGYAIIQDQNGKIIDTQIMKINGKWDDNNGVIQQNFVYSDGSKNNRTWLFNVEPNGTFEAVGHNVPRPGRGRQIGNAAQIIYSLSILKNGVEKETKFEDRIYLIDDKTAIMISKFKSGFFEPYNRAIFSLRKINGRTEYKPDNTREESDDEKEDSKTDAKADTKESKSQKPDSAKADKQNQ
jgi:hypothetical protein